MNKLKKDLQAVSKEFDALTKKAKKLTEELKKKATDQLDKARGAMKPEVAARRTAGALKSLRKTMDTVIKAVEKFEKEQAAKTQKAKAKTRVKAKTTKKVPAKKKAAAPTATEQVLKVIKRSKKGVDVPTLMKKTGFDERKVRNIVFRTFKQGNIKRTGKGIYVAA